MQLPLRIKRGAEQNLQLQIFEQIRQLILDGRLHPGARMPASRGLAADLGVSRNTVVLAYDQLASEGYVETRQPIGSFVSENVIYDGPMTASDDAVENGGDAAARKRARVVFHGEAHTVTPPKGGSLSHDFWVGRPDARLFPARMWEQLLHQQFHDTRSGISGYGDPAGLWSLREALAMHVGAARGIKASPDQILVTSGIQQGLNVLARLFVRRDTPIAIENPCYRGAANTFRSYGARLLPVEVDHCGANVAGLSVDPALLYLTPSHQYPTGETMTMERREQVLDWAARANAYVIEDDYDSDFYYDRAPMPALHSFDERGQVIYLGTFSKSLAAGLRVGYMIVPRPLIEAATAVKTLLDNCSPWLPQTLLAEFVTSGAFAHHLRRIRTIYRSRRDCLIHALGEFFGDVEIRGSQGGMHLVWQLPDSMSEAVDFERRCRDHGVGIYSMGSGNAYMTDAIAARYTRSVMLGYAALDEKEILEGVQRLAAVPRSDAATENALGSRPNRVNGGATH